MWKSNLSQIPHLAHLGLSQICISDPISSPFWMFIFQSADLAILTQVLANESTENSVSFSMDNFQVGVAKHNSLIQHFLYLIECGFGTHPPHINLWRKGGCILGPVASGTPGNLPNFLLFKFLEVFQFLYGPQFTHS